MFVYAMQLHSIQKQADLKLKTWPKQLLGSLPLTFALPVETEWKWGDFSYLDPKIGVA